MKERPILFQGEMVRAMLRDKDPKTQTRRIVKRMWGAPHAQAWMHEGRNFGYADNDGWHGCQPPVCPYGVPGDRLWVRESGWERPERTPRMLAEGADTWAPYYYDADGEEVESLKEWKFKRRPSIHMPRRFSRLTLEVVSTRVEQVQAITERDAIAEGCHKDRGLRGDDDLAVMAVMDAFDRKAGRIGAMPAPIARYVLLWDSINGKPPRSWNSNPWVWVVEFKRVA